MIKIRINKKLMKHKLRKRKRKNKKYTKVTVYGITHFHQDGMKKKLKFLKKL
jgi:hypothetical protein